MESVEYHDTIGKTIFNSCSGQLAHDVSFSHNNEVYFFRSFGKKNQKSKTEYDILCMLYSDVKHTRILLYVPFIRSPNQRRHETYVNMYGQVK